MKLFWSSRSPYARKVMVVAHEAGLADRIERIAVSVSPYAADADVLAHNPLGRIPTLVTDAGDALFESLAICDYLGSLAPRPGGRPVEMDRATVMRAHALGSGLTDLGIAWVRERLRGNDGPPADFVAAARIKIARTCDRLDTEIEALCGNVPHVGAAAIGCALAYLDFRMPDEAWRTERPRLTAWQARFSARPSMRATEHHD